MSQPDAVWAVVVARCGPTAKSRLSPVLAEADRAALALAMLRNVLATCAYADLAGTIAVVDVAEAHAVARAAGARALPDPGAGMNGAVRAGVAAAIGLGATGVLVLPSDIPLVQPVDLRAVIDAAHPWQRVAVVAPDRQGVGTNALFVRPPDGLRSAFGKSSARRHLRIARLARLQPVQVTRPRLGFDVDTPSDLAELRRLAPPGPLAATLATLRERVPAAR